VITVEYDLITDGERLITAFLESKNYKILQKKGHELFAVHKDYINGL
jgi:hypothetical protein